MNGGRRISLIGNSCADFRPILPIYDAHGKLVKDGTHNDCIQLWSVAGQEPVSDVLIQNNHARGYMQGIGQYASWGPIRNLRVIDNDVEVSFWNGIAFSDVQGAEIRGNKVKAVPGAKAANFPYQPIRSWISVKGVDTVVCGNIVPDMRGNRRNADPEVACH